MAKVSTRFVFALTAIPLIGMVYFVYMEFGIRCYVVGDYRAYIHVVPSPQKNVAAVYYAAIPKRELIPSVIENYSEFSAEPVFHRIDNLASPVVASITSCSQSSGLLNREFS